MITLITIRDKLDTLFAVVEKYLKLETRFKIQFLMKFVSPIINTLIPFFMFGVIFSINSNYAIGSWTSTNYILFSLIAFIIHFSRDILKSYNLEFQREKFWKTLPATLIAPVSPYFWLLSILITQFFLVLIPITFIIIIIYILFPIEIWIFLLFLGIYILILIIFSGFGLIIATFSISSENISKLFLTIWTITFWLSCVSFPLEIFPELIQFIIKLNPFYYFFDLLRIIWWVGIDSTEALIYITPTHIIITLCFAISMPIIGVYLFNRIYKKFGIKGY